MRARDLGLTIGSLPPGPHNAITDVAGVRVGHVTRIEGEGPLDVGAGPVRTGVTLVLPAADPWAHPVFAGAHRLNGNGEMTGLEWIRESGLLTGPVGLTNTHSVGIVRDALVAEHARRHGHNGLFWSLPVVAETWDGLLNDIDGQHVTAHDVTAALAVASDGPVAEGGVGSGTGMVCHEFKGGIGTASRVTGDGYTVGVLVQANHGRRARLAIEGVPVGRAIGADVVPVPAPPLRAPAGAAGGGSIIVILATDAPLLPHQCTRLAQRATIGIARIGGTGEHFSGDLFLAFATGNGELHADSYDDLGPKEVALRAVGNAHMDPLFDAAVEATEEAIVNAMVAAETMTGRDGVTAHAIPHDALRELFSAA
jgi:D-aminopeptidase